MTLVSILFIVNESVKIRKCHSNPPHIFSRNLECCFVALCYTSFRKRRSKLERICAYSCRLVVQRTKGVRSGAERPGFSHVAVPPPDATSKAMTSSSVRTSAERQNRAQQAAPARSLVRCPPPFPKEDEAIHQYPRADARWCQQLIVTGLDPQVESVASLVFNSTVVPEAKLRFNTFLSARVAGPVGAPRGRSYSVGLRMRWRHQKSARQQAARGQQAAAPTDH